MNDEKKEIDTEIPIKVSEKERQIVLKSLEEANRGEGLISHEDVMIHIQHLIDEYDHLPPYDNSLVIKDKKQQDEFVNKL